MSKRLSKKQSQKPKDPIDIAQAKKAISELGLKYNENDKVEQEKLIYILTQIIKYPSVGFAKIHRRANKMGRFDVKSSDQVRKQLMDDDQDSVQEDIKNKSQVNKQGQNTVSPPKNPGLPPIPTRNSSRRETQKGQTKVQTKTDGKPEEKPDQKVKNKKRMKCRCCNLLEQRKEITLGTDINLLNHAGMSTVLYFMTVRNLTILLAIMIAVFSLFAIGSNLFVSKQYRESQLGQRAERERESFNGALATSLGSKYFYESAFSELSYAAQCWLGTITIIIWAFALAFIKIKQKESEYEIDYKTVNAGDFTLQFSNIPIVYYDKPYLKIFLNSYLNDYCNRILKNIKEHDQETYHRKFKKLHQPIQINEVHKVSLELLEQEIKLSAKEFKEINEKIKKNKLQWIEFIKERKETEKFNELKFETLKKQYNQNKSKKTKLRQDLAQNGQKKKELKTFFAFVTFKSTLNKELVQRLHERQKSLYHKLPCVENRKYLQVPEDPNFPLNQKANIKIEPAPQPEDIIWKNYCIGDGKRIQMKIITFATTVVILCISFIFIFLVSEAQIIVADSDKENTKIITKILSAAISIIIVIINMIITEVIVWLTQKEYNLTDTREQTSMGMKSIFAVLVNTIAIPITVNKILKNNLYGIDGLADEIFFQAISMSLLTPILKVLSPAFLFYLIKRWWYNRPSKRFDLTQRELNKINEYPEFKIGAEYVEIVTMFLFACFYASLQPTVVVIIAIGLVLMYFAQKISLFWFSKRPTPGNSEINTAMHYFIFAGPIFYSIGSLCWANIFDSFMPGLIPNAISVIISLIVFFFPYEEITRSFVRSNKNIRESTYEQDRLYLFSDYGRVNPLTKQKTNEEYQKQLMQLMQNAKNKTAEKRKQMTQKFESQNYYNSQQIESQEDAYNQKIQAGKPLVYIYLSNEEENHFRQCDQLNRFQVYKEQSPLLKEAEVRLICGDYGNKNLDFEFFNLGLPEDTLKQIQQQVYKPEDDEIKYEDYDDQNYNYDEDYDQYDEDQDEGQGQGLEDEDQGSIRAGRMRKQNIFEADNNSNRSIEDTFSNRNGYENVYRNGNENVVSGRNQVRIRESFGLR